jgi:hypothetical protein
MPLSLSSLIRFGTSTWTYEGWQGQVYKREYVKSKFSQECLCKYCQYQYQGEPLFRRRKTGIFFVSTSFCGRMISPRHASSPKSEAIEEKGRRGGPSRLRKKYCGTVEIQWFGLRIGQPGDTVQDAQTVRSARPQRAKRRGVRFGTLSF